MAIEDLIRTVNPGLVQAIADPFNTPLPEDGPKDFESPETPFIDLLLRDDTIDPVTKNLLRDEKDRKINQARQRFKIERAEQQIRREASGPVNLLGSDEKPGILSFLGPVPIGFQIGTFVGIEDPTIRFLVDLVADPINLVSGIGGLTKLGRAAKFLKGLSPAAKAQRIAKGGRFLALANIDKEAGQAIKAAADAEDIPSLLKAFRKFGNKKLTPKQIDILRRRTGDDDFAKLLANEKQEILGLKSAFKEIDRLTELDLQNRFIDNVIEGKRGLVNIGIPFTDVEIGALRFPTILKSLKEGKLVDTAEKAGGGLKAAFSSSGKLLEDGLDVSKSSEVMDSLSTEFKRLGNIVSGKATEDILGGPSDAAKEFLSSPKGMARVASGRIKGSEETVNIIRKHIKIITKDDEKTLEMITRALENDPEGLKFLDNASPEIEQLTTEIRNFFDKIGDVAIHEGVMKELVRDGYVPHIIEPLKGNAVERVSELLIRSNRISRKLPGNKFGLPRAFESLRALEKFQRSPAGRGLFRIKTRRIDEIFEIYTRSMNASIVRNGVIDTALNAPVADGLGPLAVRLDEIGGGLSKTKAFRENYEKVFNNPAFRNFAFRKDALEYLNPLFARSLLSDLRNSPGVPGRAFRLVDGMNSVAKSALFSAVPFFHGMSLVLSNIALLPPADALRTTANVARETIPVFGRGLANSVSELIGLTDNAFMQTRQEVAESVVRMMSRGFAPQAGEVLDAGDLVTRMRLSGMTFGRTEDAQGFNVFQQILTSALNNVPESRILTSPLTGLQHINELNDRALWEMVQTGMKTMAWQHMRHAEILRNPDLLTDSVKLTKVENDIGNLVNQAFGGIAWDQLGATPQMRQFMRFAFIAPDWTTSNLLMARDFFLNLPGVRETALAQRLTRDAFFSDVRFRWAMGYNVRAALYGLAGGALLNRFFTGRWTWENDEEAVDPDVFGLKTRVELPYKKADGRRQFMDTLKQFKEPVKMIAQPVEFFRGKMGVLPRVTQTMIVGVDNFGRPINGTEGGPYQDIIARVGASTAQFLPIPAQNALQSQLAQIDPETGLIGGRDPLSVVLSTFSGFNIRSEDRQRFLARQRLKKAREDLQRAQFESRAERLARERRERLEKEIERKRLQQLVESRQ